MCTNTQGLFYSMGKKGRSMSETDDDIQRHIRVACAIIEHHGLVLAVQRSEAMSMALKWEFPGGKIRPDESPEGCVAREVFEELNLRIGINRALAPATHRYPTFSVTLYPLVCSIEGGGLVLHEHLAAVWLPPHDLLALDWAEADIPIIKAYCARR